MKTLNELQERTELLLKWYDRIMQEPFLHTEKITAEELLQRQNRLKDKRFVVAICGQMNSGKSTLMNALLFQDEVLPMSATTMTAKITEMEWAKNPSVLATLYTPEEWPQVVQAASKDDTAQEELAEARAAARAAGLIENDLLQYPGKIIEEEGTKCLLKYVGVVGVPGEGGIYTPYVKQVTLKANLPWLHQVTVVDTPGTSDPNPERDKLTKKWVQQADALIYVTYAGQAGMDAQDAAFLDEYIVHIEANKRIIAVNKCDTLAGEEQTIMSHIRGVRKGNIRMERIFSDESQIILVSGQAALISAMEKANRPMCEQLTQSKPKLKAGGWLEADKHNIHALRELIEQRLISNAGVSLIGAHTSYLSAIFEQTEHQHEGQSNLLQDQLVLLSKKTEERAQEKERIQRFQNEITVELQKTTETLDKSLEDAIITAMQEIRHLKNKITQNTLSSIAEESQIDSLERVARTALLQAVDAVHTDIENSILEIARTLENALEKIETDVKDLLLRSGIGERLSRFNPIRVSPRVICRDMVSAIRRGAEAIESPANSDDSSWDSIVSKIFPFISWAFKAWNHDKDLAQMKDKLDRSIRDILDQSFSSLEGNIEQALQPMVKTVMDEMKEDLDTMLEGKLILIADLDGENADAETRHEEITAELSAINKELEKVTALKQEFDTELSAVSQ